MLDLHSMEMNIIASGNTNENSAAHEENIESPYGMVACMTNLYQDAERPANPCN